MNSGSKIWNRAWYGTAHGGEYNSDARIAQIPRESPHPMDEGSFAV